MLSPHGAFSRARDDLVEPLEQALGPDHPDLAYSLSNLGDVYFALGDLQKAESLQRRSLDIREKALGPDSLRASFSALSLAGVLAKRGQYDMADSLFRREIKIREATLPPEHADLLEARKLYEELQGNSRGQRPR